MPLASALCYYNYEKDCIVETDKCTTTDLVNGLLLGLDPAEHVLAPIDLRLQMLVLVLLLLQLLLLITFTQPDYVLIFISSTSKWHS